MNTVVTTNSTLDEYEDIIRKGFDTFIDVGLALACIRDARLYAPKYGSFREYCEQTWEIGRARAYQLIDAAQIAEEMSKKLDTPLDREAHAAALAKVAPEKRVEVIRKARAAGNVTAKAIAAIADATPQPEARPSQRKRNDKEQIEFEAAGEVTAKSIEKAVEVKLEVIPERPVEPRPRCFTETRLRDWMSRASPAQLGQFITGVFSLNLKTVVPSKEMLRQEFERWLEKFVEEGPN